MRTWEDALAAFRKELDLDNPGASKGKRLRVLTGRVSSPTLAAQLDELLKRFPEAKWHQYEPAVSDAQLAGTRLAFGQELQPRFHLA